LYPGLLNNLLITPHVAGITESSMANMSTGSVDEMLRALQGQRFAHLVNPEIYA
jgi:D-3-phosphoglycerate dehydrogenase